MSAFLVLLVLLFAVCFWKQIAAAVGISILVLIAFGCVYVHELLTGLPT